MLKSHRQRYRGKYRAERERRDETFSEIPSLRSETYAPCGGVDFVTFTSSKPPRQCRRHIEAMTILKSNLFSRQRDFLQRGSAGLRRGLVRKSLFPDLSPFFLIFE